MDQIGPRHENPLYQEILDHQNRSKSNQTEVLVSSRQMQSDNHSVKVKTQELSEEQNERKNTSGNGQDAVMVEVKKEEGEL